MAVEEPTNETDPERLIELLRKQLDLYRRLKRLAQRQRQLVTQEDPRPLLELLAERQKVVSDLTLLSRRLGPIQDLGREGPTALDSSQRHEAESLLKEAGDTLKSILRSDEEDSQLLAARKAQTAIQVRTIGAFQQAQQAYSPAESTSPQYSRTDESA